MGNRPILANSCAAATSTAEARFRVDILPRTSWRSSRVIALDPDAERVVRHVAGLGWHTARFYSLAPSGQADPGEVVLASLDGWRCLLRDELTNADLVVMIAASPATPPTAGADSAKLIGAACAERGITAAGVVLNNTTLTDPTITALRPYTQMLLISHDEHDITELLQALRA